MSNPNLLLLINELIVLEFSFNCFVIGDIELISESYFSPVNLLIKILSSFLIFSLFSLSFSSLDLKNLYPPSKLFFFLDNQLLY